MRVFNNTEFDLDFLMSLHQGFFLLVDKSKIESFTFETNKLVIFGIDCVLGEFDLRKPIETTGKIRWFDESSGAGMIRLSSGNSVWFYSCNVVGANSHYPELVSNVQFKEGDAVRLTIDSDYYTVQALGATKIKKIA